MFENNFYEEIHNFLRQVKYKWRYRLLSLLSFFTPHFTIFKALFCYFIHFNLDFNEILAILISQGENINECITLSFININASH